jgi:hypothetical protein
MEVQRSERDAADGCRAAAFLGRKSFWRFSRIGPRLLPGLLACALLLTTADEANAMGKMCLFSAVKGVVLDHGKPVEGATIERSYKWAWKDQTGGDNPVTYGRGEFVFTAIWGHSFLGSLLPHEPVVDETILIHHDGQTYKAWMFTRGNYTENTELDGRAIVLGCRLEAEVTHHGQIYGMCEPQ